MASGADTRAVVITGASTGIGRATALHLDGRGWRVFAGVRREEDAAALREAASDRLETLLVDVADAGQVAAAAADVEQALAGGGLGGLVNNAGFVVGGPLEYLDLDELRRQYEVNLFGQVAVTQAFLPALRRAPGRVVFIGSVGGRVPLPFVAPYQSSKAALVSIAGSLRQELGRWGIGVATVEPGAVATPIWEKGRRSSEELGERLPPEAIERYGAVLERVRSVTERREAAGIPPERVARLIEKVLTTRRPRDRYLVGGETRVLFALSRMLPHRLFDRIIARQLEIR